MLAAESEGSKILTNTFLKWGARGFVFLHSGEFLLAKLFLHLHCVYSENYNKSELQNHLIFFVFCWHFISGPDTYSSHWTSLSLNKSSHLFNGNREGTKSRDGRWEKDSIQPPHIFSAMMPGKALATDPSADHWCLPQTIRMFYKPGRVLFWPWYMPFPRSFSPWEPHVKLPAKLCKFWCCFASLARSRYEKIILLRPVSSLVHRGYQFV